MSELVSSSIGYSTYVDGLNSNIEKSIGIVLEPTRNNLKPETGNYYKRPVSPDWSS